MFYWRYKLSLLTRLLSVTIIINISVNISIHPVGLGHAMLRWAVVCPFGRPKMIDSSLHVSNEESDTADWLPNSFLRFFQQDLSNIPVKILGVYSNFTIIFTSITLKFLIRQKFWPKCIKNLIYLLLGQSKSLNFHQYYRGN